MRKIQSGKNPFTNNNILQISLIFKEWAIFSKFFWSRGRGTDANFLCHQICACVSAAFLNHHLAHSPHPHRQQEYPALPWVVPVVGSCLLLVDYLIFGGVGVCSAQMFCREQMFCRPPFLAKETAKLWNQCHFPDGTHLTPRGQPLSEMITDDGKKFPGCKGHWGEPEVLLMAPCTMASDNLGDGLIRQPLFPSHFLKVYLRCHRRM